MGTIRSIPHPSKPVKTTTDNRPAPEVPPIPVQNDPQTTTDASPAADEAEPSPGKKKRTVEKRRHKKRVRRCYTGASPRQRRTIRRWQRVPRIRKPKYREGFRDLVIHSVNLGERIRVFPFLPNGELDPAVMDQIENALRDKHTAASHPIHPRLVKLIYRLADHFKARQINIISGFRETREKNEGYHGKGRAVDIVIPGVSIAALARKARQLGRVGVGLYPNSGFVHLDVRTGPSYFWIDRSGPGKRSCLRRVLTKTAAKWDRRWRPRHDEPKRHKNRKGKLRGALPAPTVVVENQTIAEEQSDLNSIPEHGL